MYKCLLPNTFGTALIDAAVGIFTQPKPTNQTGVMGISSQQHRLAVGHYNRRCWRYCINKTTAIFNFNFTNVLINTLFVDVDKDIIMKISSCFGITIYMYIICLLMALFIKTLLI